MHIFLARNNVQAGPYTLEQLNQMFSTGQISLTDLMWHEGMANWQPVGEMTGGQLFYQPKVTTTAEAVTANNDEPDYIINNRPSQPTNTATTPSDKESVWDKYNANNPHQNPKQGSDKKTVNLKKVTNRGFDISHAEKQLDLATIGSRIVAKLIDFGLMILASLPLFLALYNSPSFAKLKQWAEAGQTTLTSAQQMELLSVVPTHILLLTNLLVWGLLFAQMLLLMRRGQTLGKMVMGIRVLDKQTNAIPTFFNLIIMRSLMTSIVYSLSVFGIVAMAIDFVMMLTNKDRQSLHDKIAKTYVVRADDTQTTPLELKPE